MDAKFIKPIPKYILQRIDKRDKTECPSQKGIRLYSYLARLQKELVKITVAVKDFKRKRYYKQVAVHGVKSDNCWVRDFEYVYFGMGFRVGWHAEGITSYKKWYEDGKWYAVEFKYYNASTTTVNTEFVGRFPEYRYSAYQHFKGWCIIRYLKLYKQYPQTEFLLKFGLFKIHDSIMVLKRIAKDKAFCRWLITERGEIAEGFYYATTVLQAYKSGKPLAQVQAFNECKKKLAKDNAFRPIKELFGGEELIRFFTYLDEQNTAPRSYLDYLNACNYLKLDMCLAKNRYPHNFKRWHDIRIDQYAAAKALADAKERAELYAQFAAVAEKYMVLQKHKEDYAVIIARSPQELKNEGDALNHCVGKMGYDQKMVREETLIFFVRDASRPDTPFMSIEYSLKSKKILQCYGRGHCTPDENLNRFINKVWLPHANRNLKKLKAAA
ncbi:MAG: PcfJ domain-containing protein [Firmicutes bacterium]|nr:PcfJ domain-containing protein [Bacillota bacterium]